MGPRGTSGHLTKLISHRGKCVSFHSQKPLLVLDLDDTVIRTTALATAHTDFTVTCFRKMLHVQVRPGFFELVSRLSPLFDIRFFTDSKREFAEQVIPRIAPFIEINRCFFGESCSHTSGYRVKDLSKLDVPLERVVLVDDIIGSGLLQPMNCIGITPWAGEIDDRVLLDELLPVLMDSLNSDDIAAAARLGVKTHAAKNLHIYTV